MSITAEIVGGRIRLQTSPREGPLVKMIPGSRYSPQELCWYLPLAWSSCLAARGILGASLVVGPELNAWGAVQVEMERCLLGYRSLTDLSPEQYRVDAREHPWQRVGTEWLLAWPWALLADEMGKGKTVTTAVALRSAEKPILVVCPSSVREVWVRHLAEWAPELSVSVVTGTPTQRKKAIEERSDVTVIGWEALRSFSKLAPFAGVRAIRCVACGGTDETVSETKCQAHPRLLNEAPWGTVVADEIHRASDPSSQQTRALWAVMHDAQARWGLTGTPLTDTPADMWALLHALSPKDYPAKGKFEERWCDQGFNPYSGFMEVRGLRQDTAAEFHRLIDPHMLRRLRGPEMPPLVSEIRYAEMGAQTKQGKAYAQMAKGLVANVKGGQVIGWNPLTQTGRLLQFASAYAEVDENGDVQLSEPSCKLDVLDEVLVELGGRPVVVFAPSRQLIELAEARLTKRGIPFGAVRGGRSDAERQKSIDEFQAGSLPVMFLTAAGAEGITLTRADTFVYLQRPWSLVQDLQAVSRVWRLGQESERVVCIDIVTRGTVEERVFERLGEKAEHLEEVVRDQDRLLALLEEA